jgi:hypothetical protein
MPEMSSVLVFDEPLDPTKGPIHRLADWYRRSGSPEARAARSDINAWYAVFPDRNGMLLGNLRGDSDIGIQQATDELYVHHLLSRTYEARYEEDASSPDFRLYRSTEYVAGIEVFTLFLDQDFASKESRNTELVKGINRRVRPIQWYASIDVIDWRQQPRVKDVARWLEKTVASLPAPAANLTHEDYPSAIYSSAEVELAFEFLPRREAAQPTASDPIIVLGPPILWWGQAARRLRRNLSQKVGSRYDHRNRPFAVLISVRDHSCDTYDIVNALYGDDAMVMMRSCFARASLTPHSRSARVMGPSDAPRRHRSVRTVG